MPHRHVLAQIALIGAYLIILNFAVDTIAGAYPDVVAARGVKQAVTGA
jgi:hypothetical protein